MQPKGGINIGKQNHHITWTNYIKSNNVGQIFLVNSFITSFMFCAPKGRGSRLHHFKKLFRGVYQIRKMSIEKYGSWFLKAPQKDIGMHATDLLSVNTFLVHTFLFKNKLMYGCIFLSLLNFKHILQKTYNVSFYSR